MKQHRLLALDALRGIAAIAVLFHHGERELHSSLGFAYGYLSVDIFFLMSGFVIAQAYEPRLAAGMSFGRFVKLRFARLYPMMLLGAVLGIAIFAARGSNGPTLWLAGASALLMVPLVWSGAVLFPINIPEWSIFFEIVTNLFHRLVLPWLGRRMFAAIIALSLVLLGIAGWKLHGLANGFSPFTFWGGFPRAFLSYFSGVLICRTAPRWRPHVPALPLPLLLAGFLAIVLGEAALAEHVRASAYWLFTVMLAFPAGLMLLVNAKVPGWMERPAGWLGDLSYPLYAVHMPLLLLAAPLVLPLPFASRQALTVLVAAAIAIIALLLDRGYDRPMRRILLNGRRGKALKAEVNAATP